MSIPESRIVQLMQSASRTPHSSEVNPTTHQFRITLRCLPCAHHFSIAWGAPSFQPRQFPTATKNVPSYAVSACPRERRGKGATQTVIWGRPHFRQPATFAGHQLANTLRHRLGLRPSRPQDAVPAPESTQPLHRNRTIHQKSTPVPALGAERDKM